MAVSFVGCAGAGMVSSSVTAVIVVASVASNPGLTEALVDGRCGVEIENELVLTDETT